MSPDGSARVTDTLIGSAEAMVAIEPVTGVIYQVTDAGVWLFGLPLPSPVEL